MNGRELLFVMFENLSVIELDQQTYDLDSLIQFAMNGLKNDNLFKLRNDWNAILLGIRDRPDDKVLERFLFKQLDLSEQFSSTLQLYKHDCAKDPSNKNYNKLYKLLDDYLNEKDKDRNRLKLDGNTERGRGAHATKQGDCRQYFREGKCIRGDRCPFNHDTDNPQGDGRKRSKSKGKGKGKDNERSASRQRGRSPSKDDIAKAQKERRGESADKSKKDARPCKFFVQGKCKDGENCKFWHTPQCRLHKIGKCVMGDKCIYWHKDPNKKQANASENQKPDEPKGKAAAKAKAKAQPCGGSIAAPLLALPSPLNQ